MKNPIPFSISRTSTHAVISGEHHYSEPDPNYVQIRTQNIVLLTSDAQSLYATSSTLLVEDVIKAGFLSKLPKMSSHDQTISMKEGSPLIDFATKELKNEPIDPGATVNGFLFFYSAEKKKNILSGSALIIPL